MKVGGASIAGALLTEPGGSIGWSVLALGMLYARQLVNAGACLQTSSASGKYHLFQSSSPGRILTGCNGTVSSIQSVLYRI